MTYRSNAGARARLLTIGGIAGLLSLANLTVIDVYGRDILRGGGTTGSDSGGASTGTIAPTTAPPVPRASDTLARTSQALQSVQAMQAAARALATQGPNNLGRDPNHPGQQLPNVPNGLVAGGLQVAPGVPSNLASPAPGENAKLWQGATLPSQSATGGKTTVTVRQTDQQAFLTWQTFNIGKETRLTFDQTAGGANVSEWIAFNRVLDPSGVPSQILGSLDALGQIYVINQNGIIFGGSSQVNLHTLVASSLPINDNLLSRGLLNNPDDQFLFSSLPIPILANGGTMPAFDPPPPPSTPGRRIGDVTIQAGATISSPTTPDHVGGRIALVGPNVTNDGTISTPDGQTILAAGQQVGFTAHLTSDPSLRGLDAFVGAVDPAKGTATNSGLIEAARGNVSLVGKEVDQLSFINSSTSIALNGRVDLLADYNTVVSLVLGVPHFNPTASGTVTLGSGSVTQVLPELGSDERAVGTELALSSQINLQGKVIHMAEDALLVAPSADVALSAGTWLASPSGYTFTLSEGQIYLDSGALIDVAGSENVDASVTENIIPVQLRGSELADSPLQRNGPLRGHTIFIDIREHGPFDPTLNNGLGGYAWVGTPLANTAGYVALVQRTVGELTTAGGTVKLGAGESVVLQPGSKVDVSGGWINYAGGLFQTSRLISDGRVFDISEATPDRIYDGVYGGFTDVHARWGVVETTTNPLVNTGHFESGYVQGGNGGTLNIVSPSVALDGTMLGATVLGPRQQASLPNPSTFSLAFQAQHPTGPLFSPYSPTPPNLIFSNTSDLPAVDPFVLDESGNPLPLNPERRNEVILSPDLINRNGFGIVQINNSDGNILVPEDVSLTTAAGGSISLSGANIRVEGDMAAPGGTLNFTAPDFSPYTLITLNNTPGAQTPATDPTRGNFILGVHASVTTAGLIIDDRPATSSPDTLPLVTSGGAVSINSYDANLVAGSSIDVSGGLLIDASGKQTFGNGGSIVINAGQDPNIHSILGGHLSLDATLHGYAGNNKGGSLSILAPTIQVGGSTDDSDTLLLQPAFFDKGGFAKFSLTGLGAAGDRPNQYLPGVLIASGTQVKPVVESWILNPDATEIVLDPAVLPEALRSPVSLTFNATGIKDTFSGVLLVRGDVVGASGISIDAGAKGSVTMAGDTVTELGSIVAAGGKIDIRGAPDSTTLFPGGRAVPTVDLGSDSVLSVAGTTLLTPDALGFRTGSVLAGGSITVSGNIVAEAGSMLDVSGTSGVLDLAPGLSGLDPTVDVTTAPLVPTLVESNAGSIVFSGGQELFTDSHLVGRAGGPSANGGTLSISSGRFDPNATTSRTPLDVTLIVTQNDPTMPVPFHSPGESAIGHPVLESDGTAAPALGHFAVSGLTDGQFDSVSLSGTVRFSGPVTLTANRQLRVGTGGVIFGDDAINLNAPYVALGTGFRPPISPLDPSPPFVVDNQPYYFSPTYGPGSLNVNAGLIDIGYLSLQNIGAASLVASNGDIRGDGALEVAGTISLTAGQIYPATAVTFTIAAFDPAVEGQNLLGSISIAAAGNRQTPLSAGGELDVYASIINQAGVLRAPIGTINLGSGALEPSPTDPISNEPFAATGPLTVAPGSITSVSAIDPVTGKGLVIPYGTDVNGTTWIDPAGIEITSGGVPGKQINLSALFLADQAGSSIDLRGGGDLLAYRFVPGIGGTRDILDSSSSFAVIPSYQLGYAPFDPEYSSTGVTVGDQVFLNGGSGLAAGTYTVLPARYALLPGAFLVTPKAGVPTSLAIEPDGASIVSGYRLNGLSTSAPGQPLDTSFEISPASVLQARATYESLSANTFLRQSALSRDLAVPRLPIDSGQLVLASLISLTLQGEVNAQPPTGGIGGMVDISSPSDILIATSGGGPGVLLLDPNSLTSFGAESLLIGGIRRQTGDGTVVTTQTGNVTVDNAGAALTGPEIILVAAQNLTLAAGADIEQRGTLARPAETLLFGNDSLVGSGDGTLLRVSSDPAAQILRSGVGTSTLPNLSIGANAYVSGQSVTIDSTNATSLDPAATLAGHAVALDSGQISLLLSDPGKLNPTTGLVLEGRALENLQASAQAFSLLSYSTIDIYGTGHVGAVDPAGVPSVASLALHAAEIRGFHNGGGTASFAAKEVILDNSPNRTAPGPIRGVDSTGTLQFTAETVRFGSNQLNVDQFANLNLIASHEVLLQNSGGLAMAGNMTLQTPLITGITRANQTVSATGTLRLAGSAGTTNLPTDAGLGATLALRGATVVADSNIVLPSGKVTLQATHGGLAVLGRVDVSGTTQNFFDLTRYSSGGVVDLISTLGNVSIGSGSVITVAAPQGGGDAGSLTISAPQGVLVADGTLLGTAGTGGRAGNFSLDIARLPSTAALEATLNAGSFSESRFTRVRTGDVLLDGVATSHLFNLSADDGSISVTGLVDARGGNGGVIDLEASRDVVLSSGSKLTVAADEFDAAGKGGAVSIETTDGRLTLGEGSIIDLSVANGAGGTLHLRAPQVGDTVDVAIDPLAGNIVHASSIVAEAFFAQDANTIGSASIDDYKATAFSNAKAFMSQSPAIEERLLAANPALAPVFHVRPGEEIDNSKGDLVLDHDFDLSTWRFGPQKAVVDDSGRPAVDAGGKPIVTGTETGILTLRASGSIVLHGSITDGFGDSTGHPPREAGSAARWKEKLLPLFADGTNQESWSYRLTAGAEINAADFRRVQPLDGLASGVGTVAVGVDGGANIADPFGVDATSDTALRGHYQVIRTGTGDVEINAARDVQLLNQFATIYTAGTRVVNPTLNGNFDLPQLYAGADRLSQRLYPAQYSSAGGNVSVFAQGDIIHLTVGPAGTLVPDSERELPTSWLYRRSYIDPDTGRFGKARFGDVASTTWWIDFSDFFEGVGALGGGNVSLVAGRDISNVDAVVPTNARAPKGVPNADDIIELGGGNLLVAAGHDIDAGAYYVERGLGTLAAGNTIHTNGTRSPSLTIITQEDPYPSPTWLPTTLFLGKGSFDVHAGGDVLLGPVVNPFWLPQGVNNTYWYKTYFSTYAQTDAVDVSSEAGSVTFRETITLPAGGVGGPTSALLEWYHQFLLTEQGDTASFYQPWLRTAETDTSPFATVMSVTPPTLRATSFSSDINVDGDFVLSPSANGTVDLAAAGSINGLQITGVTTINDAPVNNWSSGLINLSDADPASIPSVTSPFAYEALVGTNRFDASETRTGFLTPVDALFAESGSTEREHGVLQAKEALHAAGLLHLNDPNPIHLYALGGDISGLTLFSGKAGRIAAARDITDIAFYIQNTRAADVTVVAAGRDIIAFDLTSGLRSAAQAPGNVIDFNNPPAAGDIQINGPGTLEVLAGRDLNLGVGNNNPDGTGLGITSIGSARNPYLPFAGAHIIAGAGVGPSTGFDQTTIGFDAFVDAFLDPASASESARYLPVLGASLGLRDASDSDVWAAYNRLPLDEQRRLALDIFYMVLRDAGRDHNDPDSPGFGNFDDAETAIAAFFPGDKWQGDISLTSREIKATNGGDISLLAPGGGITVGFDAGNNQAVDQGILTAHGGDISIFTKRSVVVGTSRIFTLRGGNEIIYSALGDIAAGASSKTVQAAPPTRVLIDPQSADVETDLAGLATGGGIGVLNTLVGVPPGDVDLVAPTGTIDAGDAGIRVSGNLNISALVVLNAGNIQVGGTSVGTPVIAAPNISGLTAASNTVGATADAAAQVTQQGQNQPLPEETPSIVTVEVLGYGGETGDTDDSEGTDDEKRRRTKRL